MYCLTWWHNDNYNIRLIGDALMAINLKEQLEKAGITVRMNG